jgi:cobalt-zinc-cadmium efflux system outer membrane protein
MVLVIHVMARATSAAADPGTLSHRAITLDEAVAAADGAPEIIAARAGEQAALGAIRVARLPPDLEASFTTNSITARESASLLVPLPWPARGPRIAVATARLLTAGRARDEARASARQALRVAWFTLAAAEERAQAASNRESRARRNADAVAALYKEGRVARLEELRANAEAALADTERASAEEARLSSGAALATLMGLPPGGTVTTAGPLPSPEPEATLDESVARAREASPAVRLQAAEAEAAVAQWRLARRLRAPGLGLNVGAEWSDPTQPGTNKFAGISVSIPIAGPASAAVALGERDQQTALLEEARREAAVAAETAWGATRAARLRFEAIDTTVLKAARETDDLTRLAYQEGKVDVFRLLDAERLLSEVEAARVDAYLAWGTAHAALLRATAREGP